MVALMLVVGFGVALAVLGAPQVAIIAAGAVVAALLIDN